MKIPNLLVDRVLFILIFISTVLSHPTFTSEALEIRQPRPSSPYDSLAKFQNERRRHFVYDPWLHHTDLRKRTIVENALDYLDDDWTGFFDDVAYFLPRPDAASSLYKVYSDIFSHAIGEWVDEQPEKNFISMSEGFVELTMEAFNGAVVPWTFVQTFAARLKHATTQGFAGSYQAIYQDPKRQIGVKVVLAVGAMVAAAA